MTRAVMPGRGHPSPELSVVVTPPRCSLAEALSEAERAMLAELGAFDAPPRLHLVPRIPGAASGAAAAPRAAPLTELRRERGRQHMADWTGRVALVAFAAWIVWSLLGAAVDGIVP